MFRAIHKGCLQIFTTYSRKIWPFTGNISSSVCICQTTFSFCCGPDVLCGCHFSQVIVSIPFLLKCDMVELISHFFALVSNSKTWHVMSCIGDMSPMQLITCKVFEFDTSAKKWDMSSTISHELNHIAFELNHIALITRWRCAQNSQIIKNMRCDG